MSKEWLEDIKERFVKYEYDYNLNGEDVEWLIQQAERVEVLEKRIKRYRVALENICVSPYPLDIDEAVAIAKKALEGEA